MAAKPKIHENITSRSIAMNNTHSMSKLRQGSISAGRSREYSRVESAGSNSPASSLRSDSAHRSLNYEARKRECAKIKEENYLILQRLKEKKSVYNVNRWEEEDLQRQRYLKNISEFPLSGRRLPSITVRSGFIMLE